MQTLYGNLKFISIVTATANLIPSGRGKKKRPWSEEECNAVLRYFRCEIAKKITPGKQKCEECIENAKGALNQRDWRDVKYYVKNQITKIRKIGK